MRLEGRNLLNLRGLGATRNLVLVNGRRYIFYDASQIVDLNTIPTFLLKNVEVVTGGGIAGRVTEVGDSFVQVEVAANTVVAVQKQAVATVLPKGTLKAI